LLSSLIEIISLAFHAVTTWFLCRATASSVEFHAISRVETPRPWIFAKAVPKYSGRLFMVSYKLASNEQKPALGEIPMAPNPPQRKVLIIKDEPSIRNVLRVLVAGLSYDGDIASSVKQMLSMIREDQFDTVLLDLRSIEPPQMDSAITELRPILVGRVLVITGEVSNPSTLEMIEHYAVPHLPSSRVTSDLSTSVAQMDDLISFVLPTK
jgi:CheY-like chemotaxis protein